MTEIADRRIQLREGIHQLVAQAAAARFVTPAAFVSMVMYDYLRGTGELNLVTNSRVSADTAPTPAKPARKVDYGPYNPSMFGPPTDDDDEDEDWGDMTPPKKANRPPTYDYDYDDKLLISKNTKPMPPLTDGESIEEILNAWNDEDD